MEYKKEKINCQNCKKDFNIESDDLSFYEKIQVPPPTFCSECRSQRRMAHRNIFFFLRNCDMCGNGSISTWHPEIKNQQFYCNDCWFSDNWNSMSYAQDFDFSKPFFEQFQELYIKVPKHISNSIFQKNSDYVINAQQDKDCYLADEIDFSEKCIYGYAIQKCKDCVDCHYINNCEIGYELVKCDDCFSVFWGDNSYSCVDCAFISGCRSCTNCFLCTNLKGVSNYILNKPASKEEIDKIKKDIFSGDNKIIGKYLKKFKELKKQLLVKPIVGTNLINSTGNFLVNCKDCKDCYSVDNSINCKYCTDIHFSRDSMDVTIYECEMSYESVNIGPKGYYNLFSHLTWFCRDVSFADECHQSSDLFGCCGLRNKQYCILNKQYTKEEYFKLKDKIIEHMKKTGEWGEFLPISFSPHGYNHTLAYEFYPMSKEEVLDRGWKWMPDIDIKTKYNLESSTRSIPQKLSEVDEKICNEILECKATGTFFKIHPNEYLFYKKYNLPIPDIAPNERNHRRWNLTKPRKLWHRKCMKAGCSNEFETSYAPERSEIIYCEKCYQQEVY